MVAAADGAPAQQQHLFFPSGSFKGCDVQLCCADERNAFGRKFCEERSQSEEKPVPGAAQFSAVLPGCAVARLEAAAATVYLDHAADDVCWLQQIRIIEAVVVAAGFYALR